MGEVPAVITRFVDCLRAGAWDGFADAYTPDALFDASVPNWHFQFEGADACASQLADWFSIRPSVLEPEVTLTHDGAVVDFEMRRTCPGNPSENHAPHLEGCRQAHIFRLREGLICEQRVYCAGEWLEEDLRRIDAEAPKVARRARVG